MNIRGAINVAIALGAMGGAIYLMGVGLEVTLDNITTTLMRKHGSSILDEAEEIRKSVLFKYDYI